MYRIFIEINFMEELLNLFRRKFTVEKLEDGKLLLAPVPISRHRKTDRKIIYKIDSRVKWLQSEIQRIFPGEKKISMDILRATFPQCSMKKISTAIKDLGFERVRYRKENNKTYYEQIHQVNG